MVETMNDILHPGRKDLSFPYAPPGWSKEDGESIARAAGLSLGEDHWKLVQALQEFFDRNENPSAREIHDALDEKFHAKGGIKYLYEILPTGPIAQGCKIAGLSRPSGSEDPSFGSVQ